MPRPAFRLAIAVFTAGLCAIALPSVSRATHISGWYFSGKGGPAFSQLRGIEASSGSRSVGKKSGTNAIGAFGMAAGYEWMYHYDIPLRTELEFINRTEVTYDASPLFDSGSSGALASTAQNVTIMAVAYWHFPVGSDKWWPYISGGLGWAHNTIKGQYTPTGGTMTKVRASSDNLAWSAGVGASLELGPHMMNDIELRYVNLGSADWGLSSADNIKTSGFDGFSSIDLIFSIRYVF